ncbi:MAG: ATP phosphoribosyltransferase regulatory subunit [Solirubrobacterales bacterium]
MLLIEVFESAATARCRRPRSSTTRSWRAAAANQSAYRFLDESGAAGAALGHDRPDRPPRSTSRRGRAAPAPRYLASTYRAVRPQRGQSSEFVQAGVELIGARRRRAFAEVIEGAEVALDAWPASTAP